MPQAYHDHLRCLLYQPWHPRQQLLVECAPFVRPTSRGAGAMACRFLPRSSAISIERHKHYLCCALTILLYLPCPLEIHVCECPCGTAFRPRSRGAATAVHTNQSEAAIDSGVRPCATLSSKQCGWWFVWRMRDLVKCARGAGARSLPLNGARRPEVRTRLACGRSCVWFHGMCQFL
jgi:hypothetical protein